ncbi:MAG: hypothetical protein U0529_03375 [Thermoanaerobaculia bacterium]
MNDDESLGQQLRAALPPVAESPVRKDLWPLVLRGPTPRRIRPWVDLTLAAAVALLLACCPGWVWLLVFNL